MQKIEIVLTRETGDEPPLGLLVQVFNAIHSGLTNGSLNNAIDRATWSTSTTTETAYKCERCGVTVLDTDDGWMGKDSSFYCVAQYPQLHKGVAA